MDRRKFIQISAAGTTLMQVQPQNNLKPVVAMPGFELLIFATNWGFDGGWKLFTDKIKASAYDGAEFWFPADEKERTEIVTLFNERNLKYGLLVGGHDNNFQKHFDQFKSALEGAIKMNPVYINCHSGRDHFSFDQNQRFFELTIASAKTSGIPIYHETHRSRILYSAPVARTYIEKLSDLQVTLDVSHWCNVHESLLEDQQQTMAMVLPRVGHIHARIGHPEGPQVNDPRAPEWKAAWDAHFKWWDEIVNAKKAAGKRITFLTEFGPADYMPSLPYTKQPLANQWDINVHMLNTLRKRYAL
jgi:sugar phosphate isomerase/epimerase